MKLTKTEMCLKAMTLFREHGFDNVSVNDICAACGVTRGSFYHHFEDKYDLLLFWQTTLSKQHSTYQPTEALNSYQHLERYLQSYAESIAQLGHDLLYASVCASVAKGSRSFVSPDYGMDFLDRNALQYVQGLIEKAQADGHIGTAIPAAELLTHYNTALTGLCVMWYQDAGQFDFVSEALKIAYTIFR